MNNLRTVVLMAGLTVLFVYVGQVIGGRSGMLIAFGMAFVMNVVSYWFSDKIVLAMYGAKPIDPKENPRLTRLVANLAQAGDMPVPRLYLIPSVVPNAFATGRNPHHACVAVTAGILELLTDDELSGVLAHELSHVKNRDILIGTIAAVMAGAIFMLARMAQYAAMFGGSSRDSNRGGNPIGLIAIAILAPVAAMLIQMAISRSREYQADRSGGEISGKPMALANALLKLSNAAGRRPLAVSPVTAHLFIVNPLTAQSFASLFSTHPPTQERVKRLQDQAAGL